MGHVEWVSSSGDAAPIAALLPGGGYTVQGPLLYWCSALLLQRGWRVFAVSWSPEACSAAEPRHHVEAELEAVTAAAGRPPEIVVAKSLGSHALPWSVDHGIAGVWLTPVLTDRAVREALGRATSSHLAIGGTLDAMWEPAATLTTRADLKTFEGADHSILIPSDWEESMRIQRDLMTDIGAHIHTQVRHPYQTI